MRENFEKAFRAVLKHEGGFVNHPDDPGGMTNLGVTRTVWQNWNGRKVSEQEMRALTPQDVEPLYRGRFWNPIRGDELPSGVDYAVFDAAVNSGTVRAIKWLQQAVGIEPDGKFGPRTMAAVAEKEPDEIVEEVCARRMAFLQRLPIWKVFGRGWRNRVAEVGIAAQGLIQKKVS